MEPVLSRLLVAVNEESAANSNPPRWHDIYDNIPVDVSAEWDAFELTLRDLSTLNVDDVIEMSPELLENESSNRRQNLFCWRNWTGRRASSISS